MTNLNLEIKDFFISNYIEERQLRKLTNKYRKKSTIEQRTQLRTAPIRYGLGVMLNDKNNELVNDYARDDATTSAFELLRLIHKIDSKLKLAERAYIKKEVNKYIYATTSGLGLLVEVFACASFQHEENEVSIGDFNGKPDVTIIHRGKFFKIQCKSVSLRSKSAEKHRGLELVLTEIRRRSNVIKDNQVSSAWQLKYPEWVKTKHHAEVLVNQISMLKLEAIEHIMPLDKGGNWARLRSVGFAMGTSTQPVVFDKALSKFGRRALHSSADFTVDIIEDIEQPGPSWGVMLVTIDDHESLIDRCEQAFKDAMKQFTSDSEDSFKIVYISVAGPHQLYNIAEGLVRKDDLQPYIERLSNIYFENILERICKSSRWNACFGVKLEFVWAPLVFDVGVRWRRCFTWMSHTGRDPLIDLPPMVDLI